MRNRELAKTGELNFISGLESELDLIENGLHGTGCLIICEIGSTCDALDEVGLGPGSPCFRALRTEAAALAAE